MRYSSLALRLLSLNYAILAASVVAAAGCYRDPAPWPLQRPPEPAVLPPAPLATLLPEEGHFADLRQLTFGGENAEAYWAFSGQQLIFQASPPGAGCDQIYRMNIATRPAQVARVSTGQGATTCAYFLPGDREIVYASTHLGGATCPPKPDRSQGYVWALYPSYDIFRANADGSGLRALTSTPGYDAEATVCGVDGSIIFTSVRDGDLDLYRMNADGSDVKRLTNEPGYDGGAFFNADCSKIVWRASRPAGQQLADYQTLLGQGLVRPTKLELYVANADGSDARQVTYLDVASFAPFFYPSSDRIIFSSNYGDPAGREFDLWSIDVDGTDLERITHAQGFDGFPMFSPDGRWIAFGSNRATAPGQHDTNVFLARWIGTPTKRTVTLPADRVQEDVRWLADPARKGRGLGMAELEQAGAYLEKRFGELGVSPGLAASFRQPFEVVTRVTATAATQVSLNRKAVARDTFQPLAQSANGTASGRLVAAGYGIVAEEIGHDDYKGLRVKDRIVMVRRFVPPGFSGSEAKYSDLRYKAWAARERGAAALIVVDMPLAPDGVTDFKPPAEAPFPSLALDGKGDAGIPVIVGSRAEFGAMFNRLDNGGFAQADITVHLEQQNAQAFNVVGRLPANAPEHERLPGTLVIGAHYDHLGLGGQGSLAPDSHAPHLGADDNASGVAALLEVVGAVRSNPSRRRDILLVGFSAEESGVIGSSFFVRNLPSGLAATDIVAMLNMDMVGRVRNNRLSVLGGESASEWPELVTGACEAARMRCSVGGSGYGPSDHTPFYAAGVPVLHFFSGAHGDYHKPSDTVATINAAGIGQVAAVVGGLVTTLDARPKPLTYHKSRGDEAPGGDVRAQGASLGTVPDYAGTGASGIKGMLLAGVRSEGPADRAGMRRGDLLVKLGPHTVNNVRDLMYALRSLEPNQTVQAVIVRDGNQQTLDVTMGRARPR